MDKLERIRLLVRRAGRWLVVVNGIVTVALGAAVGLGVWDSNQAATASESEKDKDGGDTDAQSISVEEVSAATTGKAIFRTNATRKVKVVDEVSHYQLQGVSVRDGSPTAYVRDVKLKKTLIKKIGDTLGSYEIKEITNQGLTLKRGAEEAVLSKG